jgi:hypothetical protein
MKIEELHKRHPAVFKETLGSIDVDEGWIGLLDEMMTELDAKGYEYQVDYIKEKFGQLRISLDYRGNLHKENEWYDIQGKYEGKSLVVCEVCGKPGMLRQNGWMRTLCNLHGEGRPMSHFTKKANHVCKRPWDTCPECKEPICQNCSIACYNCVKAAYRHQDCAKKHMDETKHEGNLNDLAWLVSLTDHNAGKLTTPHNLFHG